MKISGTLYLLSLIIVMHSCQNNKAKNFNGQSPEANRGVENARAQNLNGKTQVDDEALGFIKVASESGLTEVKASTLAQVISKNPRIISFAKMMVADHSQTNKELAKLATDKMVIKADTISRQHQKTIDSINSLPKAGFDQAYINMMVNDHIVAIKLFENISSNSYQAIQDLAKKRLPKLKMHLDTAKAIYSTLK